VGTPGGVTEQQILDQLLATPPQSADMIVICHNREENSAYSEIQKQMDQWLSRHEIPVIHCVFTSMPNHEFAWGQVDKEIMQYTSVSRHYRVMATWEESDNGIDYTGNQRAARILLDLIEGTNQ
jgi:CRISPR/Cas system CMR-associated protein Cmr1 (group 7 of RAMP superfamily)